MCSRIGVDTGIYFVAPRHRQTDTSMAGWLAGRQTGNNKKRFGDERTFIETSGGDERRFANINSTTESP